MDSLPEVGDEVSAERFYLSKGHTHGIVTQLDPPDWALVSWQGGGHINRFHIGWLDYIDDDLTRWVRKTRKESGQHDPGQSHVDTGNT